MTTNPSERGLLSDRVEQWADTKPDDVSIIYEDRQRTWSQWRDRIRQVSGALLAEGKKRGDVVAFVDKLQRFETLCTRIGIPTVIASTSINIQPGLFT
jgi:acyl-CoA synthetase (AMP-forming)/AMP-acid ligase II